MSAVILSFPRIRANTAQSDCVLAERRIRNALHGMPGTIVTQAQERAARRIRAGACWTLAADIAIKWARNAEHNKPEPPSAA